MPFDLPIVAGVGLTPHQNFALAQTHFTKVARTLWPSDSPVAALSGRRKHNGKPIDRFEDKALTDAVFLSASMLGRMHLRGEVKVRIDNEKDFGTGKNAKERIERARDRERWRLAKLWFERGAEFVRIYSPLSSSDVRLTDFKRPVHASGRARGSQWARYHVP